MTEPKFMTPAHRRAYLTHLNRCKAMDSYHRALIYTLTAVPALRNNIDGSPITFGMGTMINLVRPMTCSTAPLHRICMRR